MRKKNIQKIIEYLQGLGVDLDILKKLEHDIEEAFSAIQSNSRKFMLPFEKIVDLTIFYLLKSSSKLQEVIDLAILAGFGLIRTVKYSDVFFLPIVRPSYPIFALARIMCEKGLDTREIEEITYQFSVYMSDNVSDSNDIKYFVECISKNALSFYTLLTILMVLTNLRILFRTRQETNRFLKWLLSRSSLKEIDKKKLVFLYTNTYIIERSLRLFGIIDTFWNIMLSESDAVILHDYAKKILEKIIDISEYKKALELKSYLEKTNLLRDRNFALKKFIKKIIEDHYKYLFNEEFELRESEIEELIKYILFNMNLTFDGRILREALIYLMQCTEKTKLQELVKLITSMASTYKFDAKILAHIQDLLLEDLAQREKENRDQLINIKKDASINND